MSYPIEWTFIQTYLKDIKNRSKLKEDHVLGSVLEPQEYAEHVGYIKAMKDVDSVLQEMLGKFFPDYKGINRQ